MTTSTKSLLILSSLLQLAFSLETKAIAKDSTEKKVEVKETILDTVDIGNDDFFTPFILNGTSEFGDEDAAVKEQIDTRDFASDEFYMRNIDREEFEQERLLMMFVDEDQNRRFKTWVQLREEEDEEEDKF